MFNQWRASRRGGRLVIVAVVALPAGGGYAFAATTSNGVIRACAAKRGGALRAARKCRKSERAVLWNMRGVPGKNGTNGSNGTNGTNGTNGASGPSDTYAAGASFGSIPGSYTQIASITVPPGSYLLGAKTTIAGSTTNAAIGADCVINTFVGLGPPMTVLDEGSLTTGPIAGSGGSGVVSLAGAATYTSQQTLILSCKSTIGSPNYDDARIWAINTGTLHATLPLPTD
jgi:hypothetical protein